MNNFRDDLMYQYALLKILTERNGNDKGKRY